MYDNLDVPIRRFDNWRLYNIGGDVAVDTAIRYDQLDDGIAEVTGKLGLARPDLPRANTI